MKMVNSSILMLITCLGCSPSDKQKSENSEVITYNQKLPQDTIQNKGLNFFEVDKMISEVDRKTDKYQILNSFEAPINAGRDTLKTSLYLENNKPVKLSYTVFDDGGNAGGKAVFYFDNSGYTYAHKLIFDVQEIIEVYLGKHKLIKYTKKEGKLTVQKTNSQIDLYREAVAVKTLDNLMLLYPEVNYIAPKPGENAPPTLITLKNVKLYEEPSLQSKVIENLAPKEPLIYLGNNRKIEKTNEKIKLWINVKSGKNIGWVLSTPNLIGDNDDEGS